MWPCPFRLAPERCRFYTLLVRTTEAPCVHFCGSSLLSRPAAVPPQPPRRRVQMRDASPRTTPVIFERRPNYVRSLAEGRDPMARSDLSQMCEGGEVSRATSPWRASVFATPPNRLPTAPMRCGLAWRDRPGRDAVFAEAVGWSRRAAMQGHAWAQGEPRPDVRRGRRHARQDYIVGYFSFSFAPTGFPASGEVAEIPQSPTVTFTAERMTPEQIAEAQRMTREWTPTWRNRVSRDGGGKRDKR